MSLVACRALWQLPDSGAWLLIDTHQIDMRQGGHLLVVVEIDHQLVSVPAEDHQRWLEVPMRAVDAKALRYMKLLKVIGDCVRRGVVVVHQQRFRCA